jgi:hypothetical protein
MTINRVPSRRSQLLSHKRPGALKRRRAAFLIENTRLELRSSHRKLNPLKIPNREQMAMSDRVAEPPAPADHQFLRPPTRSLSSNQPPCRRLTRLKFLFVTQGLEFPLKRVKTISSKFLVVTKRSFSIRPAAWDLPPSLNSPNFNLNQRNELRLKWHRHSCLCSGNLQPTTITHHPRPHFTYTSTQPDPPLQSNFREPAEAA